MAIIKLNNNSLTSVTALPSGLGSDPDLKVDVARLGLRVFANQNLAKQNSTSSSYDVFQDSTGVTNLTNCIRNADEYVSTVQTDPNTKILLTFESSVAGIVGADADSYSASIGGGSGTLNSSTKKYGSNSLQLSNDEYLTLIPATGDLFGDAYSGDFTIELWFYGIGGSGSYRTLFGKSDHASNVEDFRTYFNSTFGAVNFDTNVGGTDYYVNGVSTTNPTSQFNHYAFVRDGTNIRLYVNGVQGGSASVGSGTLDDDYSSIQFGRSYVGGNESKVSGYYDDIRLSNICRYPDGTSFTPPTEQLVYSINNATGSFEGVAITASSTTKMGAVITYKNNAGTNALNSDIVLKLSADNGSNYTTATLVDNGDLDSTTKVASVSDVTVTAGTQLKYKIEFANQASGSKEARITGVALQY